MEAIPDLEQRAHSQFGLNPIVIICILLIGIRIIFINIMGIMPQDAYYDFYAQHIDLSYYDHPPLIAYILRLFTTLFGKKVIVLKLADFTITLFTIIAFYKLAGKFLSRNKTQMATALLISTLMVSILSLISTPDVPLMLCWAISLIFLYDAIWKKKNICWVWSGIFTGLSFDSKYTALFLIIGLVGFLMMTKSFRNLIISKWFFLYLISFVITILPVVIWNAKNNFASFRFQSEGRVQEGLHVDITGFIGVIGHQSAILLPTLFFSLVYFIYRYCRKYGIRPGRIPSEQLFLLCFFIPLFLGFIFISFFYWVKTKLDYACVYYRYYLGMQVLEYKMDALSIDIFTYPSLLHAIEIIFYVFPIRSDDTWFGWTEFSEKVTRCENNILRHLFFHLMIIKQQPS